MYLRELRINGFKSFADRTPVRLARGVTCIVGPNGCGKSNIVDAIRWVLGEQSAKALRGGKMQDVIFQGTDRRQPLPACEVALTFADCEAELGTAFNEVEVSRRVDREGPGDYFLNGKRCRLKDIQQLFMDTGIGRSGYSFMMQGQIDQILSSNPQERRTIFEEAAGITKYKAQRKEALNKLALTEQNLARVTDVIEQMTRQLGSLKRQASKALRYQRLKHRLTHLDLASLANQYERRQKTLTEFEEKAAGLRSAVAADQQAQAEAEERLTVLKGDRAKGLETVQGAQQAVFDLRSEKESAENRIQFAGVRQQDLAERIAAAEREVAGMREQLTALAEKRQSAAEAKAAIETQVSGADQFFAERQTAFDALSKRLAEADRERNQIRAQLSQKEGTLSRLRTQVTNAEVALRTYEVKHAALADAVHEGGENLASAEARVEELSGALGQKEAAVAEAKSGVEQAREGVTARRASFRELQSEIADTDRELAKAAARLSTLEDMQARFEGFSAGAKAILQGKLGGVLPPGQYQPLSAVIEA
ncbi:MAG: chromosome segregation SMC family protein, partial [Opitutales bacterium]